MKTTKAFLKFSSGLLTAAVMFANAIFATELALAQQTPANGSAGRGRPAGEFTPASSYKGPVRMGSYDVKETGQRLEVYAENNPAAEIQQYSPRNYNATMLRGMQEQAMSAKELAKVQHMMLNPFAAQCSGSKILKTARFLVRDFPIEKINFDIAMGIMAGMKMAEDPVFFRHWWQRNPSDLHSWESFLGFVAGSRFTVWLLQVGGLAFDPCSPKAMTPRRMLVQKMFKPLIGPLALAGGSLFYSVAQEFVNDKNVHTCIDGMFKELSPHEKKMREEACEVAYEDWAVSHKINQYAGQLASNIAASLIQGYGINLALKQVAKLPVIKIAIKAVGLGSMVGTPYGWVARFVVSTALSVGSTIAFFYPNDYWTQPSIEPWIKKNLSGKELAGQMEDFRKTLEELERKGWKGDPQRPEFCDSPRNAGLLSCTNPEVALGRQLRRIATRQRQWREFLLREATQAQANWADHLLNFSDGYLASFNFYNKVLGEIANHRYHNSTAEGFEINPLYSISATAGLRARPWFAPNDAAGVRAAFQLTIQPALNIARYELGVRETGRVKGLPGDVEALKKIISGLEGVDLSEESPDAELTVKIMLDQAPALDRYDRASLEWKAREKNFAEAMTLLHRMAQLRRAPLGIIRDPNEPFGKIKAALGSPKPMAEGLLALSLMDYDPQTIPPSFTASHPTRLGNADTPNPSDYLLASMVCGPGPATDRTKERTQEFMRATRYIPGLLSFGPIRKEKEDDVAALYKYMTAGDAIQAFPRSSYPNGPRAEDLLKTEKKLKFFDWDVSFQPPRIINELGVKLCDQMPESRRYNNPYVNQPFDIHNNSWKIGGVEYKGFLEIVKQQVRNDIIGPNAGDFEEWWGNNVDIHVKGILEKFREEYDKIMKEKFMTALLTTGDETFDGGNFKLQLGVTNSLLKDAQFNIDALTRIFAASKALSPEDAATVARLLPKLSRRFDLTMGLLGSGEPKADVMFEIRTGKSYFAQKMKAGVPAGKFEPSKIPYAKSQSETMVDLNLGNEVGKQVIPERLTGDWSSEMAGGPKVPTAQLYQALQESLRKEPKIALRNHAALNMAVIRAMLTELDRIARLPNMEPTISEASQGAVFVLSHLMTETDNYFSLVNTVSINGIE